MRAPAAGLLAGLGVLAIAGGWYFGARTTPSEQTAVPGGTLMFPDLAPKLQNVARIEITHQGRQTVIEKRADGGWGVASMRDYPVREARLRGLLTGLTELRLAEPRTSDPAQFSRLGVDGNLSITSSTTANRVKIIAAMPEPMNESGVPRRLSQFACAPQATTVGAVKARRPDTTPIRNAKSTI